MARRLPLPLMQAVIYFVAHKLKLNALITLKGNCFYAKLAKNCAEIKWTIISTSHIESTAGVKLSLLMTIGFILLLPTVLQILFGRIFFQRSLWNFISNSIIKGGLSRDSTSGVSLDNHCKLIYAAIPRNYAGLSS